MAVFGAQHGCDLPHVGSVVLLLHIAWEGDRDNSLCDVDQVQLVIFIQGLQQTHAPVGKTEELLPCSMGYLYCTEQFCTSAAAMWKKRTESRWGIKVLNTQNKNSMWLTKVLVFYHLNRSAPKMNVHMFHMFFFISLRFGQYANRYSFPWHCVGYRNSSKINIIFQKSWWKCLIQSLSRDFKSVCTSSPDFFQIQRTEA